MKSVQVILLLAVASGAVQAQNPLAKVFQLIDGLKAQIVADGEAELKAYQKFADYCGLTAGDVEYEIESSSTLESKLSSKVTKLESDIEVGDTKVGEHSTAISKAESELKGATAIRKKEAEEFVEGEKALMNSVDSLERALSQLEKQAGAGKSFAQLDESTLASLMQTLSVVDDAAGFSGSNMDALTALVQAHDEEGDEEMGAPKASTYNKQDGGIMGMIEDMRDKAEGQLSDLRNSETKAKNTYQLLAQGLEDEISAAKKELADEKSAKAEAAEEKASATGDLEVTTKEKKAAGEKQDGLQSNCQTVAADHTANVAARKEELKVIGEAERILQEATSGAAAAAGAAAASFLQVRAATSQKVSARQLASAAVVKSVQQLAKQQHSASLAQLASRISAELRYSTVRHTHGQDPFKKVNDMISAMIGKLEKEAAEEATEKAYCDEELAKTEKKQGELEDSVSKLAAKIAKAASKSSELKEEVSELMNELSVVSKEQAQMDTMRREENAAHRAAKKDLEQGLGGVRKALSVLREFYGAEAAAKSYDASLLQSDEDDQDNMSSLMQEAVTQPAPPQKAQKSEGAGTGIISLLEVVESDLAKNLATEDAEESDAQSTYEKQTQANKIASAQKQQDAKFKTQEFKALDKSISESEADKSTEVDELNAVNEYFSKVKQRCIAKPSSYEELKSRRDAEITGLKDALANVESQALMQVGTHRRARGSLRGDALRADDTA